MLNTCKYMYTIFGLGEYPAVFIMILMENAFCQVFKTMHRVSGNLLER